MFRQDTNIVQISTPIKQENSVTLETSFFFSCIKYFNIYISQITNKFTVY
jgi:hypothetical protein